MYSIKVSQKYCTYFKVVAGSAVLIVGVRTVRKARWCAYFKMQLAAEAHNVFLEVLET